MSRRVAVLALCLLAVLSATPRAHEIPNEVTVRTFLKPEGHKLIFLVRAPLKAMREMDVPRREGGFVDLERVDPVLRDAAMQWIADFVKLYEDGRPLPKGEVAAARISIPGDRSFDSYEQALADITAGRRLPLDTDLRWEEGLLDVEFEYPIQSEQARFSISPGL